MTMMKAEDNQCPRCGGDVPDTEHKGEYPGAVSRWMEKGPIEVCSQCGTDEALIQWMAHLAEARPWVKGPA